MESIYVLFAGESDIAKIEECIERYHDRITDYERSKTFSVQGNDVTVYSIVTTKEIFDTITVEIGGTKLF